jgi:hypothetical protein
VTAVVRCGTLLGFVVVLVACTNTDRPTLPSSLPTGASSLIPPPPVLPPVPATARLYLFDGPLSYQVSHYTTASRFVLYDGGTFSLQYPSLGGLQYVGTYRQEDTRVTFVFSADGRWDATGTLNGDSLEVRYNLNMELSDFENAVYLHAQ